MAAAREQSAGAEARVVSADGTEIAFEQSGRGPAVVLVASALADRSDTTKLAALLAQHFTVINYDRRGRGASGDASAYAPDREIEDIAALVEHVGGSASLFGSSSGAVLALRAAAAGVNVDRLALYEPPFVVAEGDDGPPEDLAQQITALLAEGRHNDAVTYFVTRVQGMPGIAVFFMELMPRTWANLTELARTLPGLNHGAVVMAPKKIAPQIIEFVKG